MHFLAKVELDVPTKSMDTCLYYLHNKMMSNKIFLGTFANMCRVES